MAAASAGQHDGSSSSSWSSVFSGWAPIVACEGPRWRHCTEGTPDGGIASAVYVTGGAVAATTELTEAELAALTALGRGGRTAALLLRAGAPTPAQIARARGLSGTNSVGGSAPPGFRSTQKWDTSRNCEILRDRFQKTGKPPGKGEDVHHIVPSTHRLGERARRVLDEAGIDINGLENGAILPRRSHHGRGLHSKSGIDAVFERVFEAFKMGGRPKVIVELDRISAEIRAGTFPPR